MGFRLKKVFTWIGICLVVLISAGLFIRAIFNYSSGKKLEKFLEQRKSAGIPLSLKDIEPECNPLDNAALDWKIVEGTLASEKEKRGILTQMIDDFYSGRDIDEKMKVQVQEFINENRKALNFVLDASSKSCFKYEEEWDELGYDYRIVNAVNMILSIRLLCIDAVFKAEEGNVAEAIEQCLATRRFLKLYLQEPYLISYLVGMACVKTVGASMKSIISNRNIATETLKKVLHEWDSSPWDDGLIWAIRTENIIGFESAVLYLKGEYDLELGKAGDIFYWILRPVLKNEIIWLTKAYDRLIEAAKMPYFASRETKKIEQITSSIPKHYKMVGALLPNFTATLLKKATLDALFDTSRIGIASKIYKNLYGEFPENAAVLVPEFLEEVPVDPFTGKPYIYKKQDSGFIVYSIGSNQKDEAGRGTWQITSLVMAKDDDWAWEETPEKQQ